MLADVLAKGAAPKPKLVAQSAGVGSALRHLPQDELDAYIDGRLAGTRLDNCRNHLDACEACRTELEDQRTFKASAVGLSQASSLKRELDRRRRQRQLKAAAIAATAAAVVAAVAVVGWKKYGKAWVHSTITSTVGSHGAAPAAQMQAAARPMLSPAAQMQAAARPKSSPAPQMQAAAPPMSAPAPQAQTSAPRMRVPAQQVRAPAPLQAPAAPMPAPAPQQTPASTSFALLGPFGDEIADDRPEFAWQPLAGATKYSIIIVDEGLRPIAHSRVKTTSWRPNKPLRRARTYLWQVTAIMRNGTKVMATGPTSQEAHIHITGNSK